MKVRTEQQMDAEASRADAAHQFNMEQTERGRAPHKNLNSVLTAELLDDLDEFLDGQADAEYCTDSPSPVGNTAMKLLVRLRNERKT